MFPKPQLKIMTVELELLVTTIVGQMVYNSGALGQMVSNSGALVTTRTSLLGQMASNSGAL